jgi:hypothetical protein
MAKVPISATIESTTNDDVLEIAEKDNKRSFSAMLNILLCEAIAARKKAKSVRKKQGGSNNA